MEYGVSKNQKRERGERENITELTMKYSIAVYPDSKWIIQRYKEDWKVNIFLRKASLTYT